MCNLVRDMLVPNYLCILALDTGYTGAQLPTAWLNCRLHRSTADQSNLITDYVPQLLAKLARPPTIDAQPPTMVANRRSSHEQPANRS